MAGRIVEAAVGDPESCDCELGRGVPGNVVNKNMIGV